MTSAPVVGVTDELLAEIERECRAGSDEYAGMGHKEESALFDLIGDTVSACATELRRLRAEVEVLRKVCKDVAWRVSDTCDQLQATGFDGDRRYGLDEWSAPIKNLNMAVGILERAMQSNTEGK